MSIWLVVSTLPLWKMMEFVSWDMFQTTNQVYLIDSTQKDMQNLVTSNPKKGNGMQSKMKLFLPKWQDDQSLQFNDVELLNLTIPMDQLRGASAPATGPSTAWPGWAARGAVSARCPVGPATRRATCLDGDGTARDVITGGLRSSKWRIDVAIRCFCNWGYMEIIELEWYYIYI